MDLGRFQPGQVVTIGVATVDGSDNPVAPLAAPVATVTNSSSDVVFSGKIAMNLDTMHFALPIFLGILYPLGTYTVSYTWSAVGFSGSASDTFEVIGGGDIGGRVISIYAYVQPQAQYVIAQLSSGNIVQGRNPRL